MWCSLVGKVQTWIDLGGSVGVFRPPPPKDLALWTEEYNKYCTVYYCT